MANNTNIQFYTDTRTVFTTSDLTGKTAIGSADATVQGFEIEYDLLTPTPKAFKISPLGVNYTDGVINDTTPLPRIAQVDSLIQSLETPPDATTLQVDKRILLTDGVSSSSIGISGTDTLIDASNNLILDPVGGVVDLSGNTLDMGSGEIHQCQLIHSLFNNNITVEGRGTGDVILKTNSVNRLTISDTGTLTFQGASGGMSYNNGTNTLTVTNLTGLASNSTSSVNSTNLLVTADNTSGTYYPTFVKTAGSGNKPFFIDTASPMTYNPSTGVMLFPQPPTCAVSATTANQLLNFNNFIIGNSPPTLISSGGGTVSYDAIRLGRSIRINNICIYSLELRATNIATLNAGNLSISLPFDVSSEVTATLAVGFVSGLAAAGAVEITASADAGAVGATRGVDLYIRKAITDTASVNLTKADIATNFRVRISGSYFV
jgi:hypothetical protein